MLELLERVDSSYQSNLAVIGLTSVPLRDYHVNVRSDGT